MRINMHFGKVLSLRNKARTLRFSLQGIGKGLGADGDGATNYVIDPKTINKVTAEHPSLTNSLENIKALV